MKKWKSFLKLNNRGSSMTLALVAIIFVTLLASTVLAVSVSNLSLKRVETSSKKAFYTAETAVDELYNALGQQALTSMNDAYVDQLSEQIDKEGNIADNTEANKAMKIKFLNNVLEALTSDPDDSTVVAGSITGSSTYISAPNLATVNQWFKSQIESEPMDIKSVGTVSAYASDSTGYYVEIKDVVINYKSESGYYADITTDFRVTYPEVDVVFYNASSDEFLDYCLLADIDVSFGNLKNDTVNPKVPGTGVTATVNSGIYAGALLNVYHGSNVTLSGNSKVVSHSGINITSGQKSGNEEGLTSDEVSSLTVDAATVWTKGDVALAGEFTASPGAALTTTANSKLYVLDDLEMNVEKSSASISGAYYGYGYSNLKDQANSSFIMNKNYCELNVNATTLMLLGHAFVDIGTQGGYETGESSSIKNTQEIYLVLDSFLQDKVTNPFSGTATGIPEDYTRTTSDILKNYVNYDKLQNFFAYSLLDSDKPVTLEYDSSKNAYYLYYNFSKSSGEVSDGLSHNQELYAKAVLTGELTVEDGDGNVTETKNVTADEYYQQERKILEKNIRKTFKNGGSISINASEVSVLGPYASAMSYSATAGVSVSLAGDTLKIQDTIDKDKKTIAGASTLTKNIANYLEQLYGGNMSKTGAFDNYVNVKTAKLEVAECTDKNGVKYTGFADSCKGTDDNTYALRVVNTNANYTVTDDYGIIIYTGSGTVTVEKDFTGLILSDGYICVKSGSAVEITSNRDVLSAILDEKTDFAKFFSAYYTEDAEDGSSIAGLDYDDFVSLRNWRKFDDDKSTDSTS
jgi:hypothetical protein